MKQTILILFATLMAATAIWAQAPANDDLCNATPLTLGMACNGVSNINTDFATAQTGEPNFTCGTSAQDTLVHNSVWYSFTAPAGTVYLLAAPNMLSDLESHASFPNQ